MIHDSGHHAADAVEVCPFRAHREPIRTDSGALRRTTRRPVPALVGSVYAPFRVPLTRTENPGVGGSRKLDYTVWNDRQLYVVAAGNEGSTSQTIESPGVAKNALTVGAVLDYGNLIVGDIATQSSRGPTGDGRMKPNVVAPGYWVTSTEVESTNGYVTKGGTSMATPHVTGLAATLMDHYSDFRLNPALVRAHMMATAIAHDGVTGESNDYGLGRVSGYLAHWAHPNSDGWSTYWSSGYVNAYGYQYRDITVPPGTHRLVVVLTWDEPPASAGASRAVLYDLDLWLSYNGDCGDPPPERGAVGTGSSTRSRAASRTSSVTRFGAPGRRPPVFGRPFANDDELLAIGPLYRVYFSGLAGTVQRAG